MKKYLINLIVFYIFSFIQFSIPSLAIDSSYIDIFLLIDGSGSMTWPGRDPDGLRIQGAKLFVDLCDKGDRIGLIEFSDDAKILFPLFEIIEPKDRINLKSRIDKIKATGEFTDITSALKVVLKRMSKSRINARKAVILLTDGDIDPNPAAKMFYPFNKKYRKEILAARHNKSSISNIRKKFKKIVADISRKILEEKILPQYKEKKIPIITIAFGRDADINLLRQIADFTSTDPLIRNFYTIDDPSDLQPTFSQIAEQLKGKREKIIQKKVKFTGEEITHKIKIDNFIREVNFKFIFSKKIKPGDIRIILKAPDGTVINETTKTNGISHIFEPGYELYSIFNPVPGTWEANIKGEKDVKLYIVISTWGITKLRILSKIQKKEYLTGDSIPILASLELNGEKITSKDFLENLKFVGIIENPDHKIETIELFDDGAHSDTNPDDGIFGNIFAHTSIAGDYIIKVIAKGITTGMRNFRFTREAEFKIHVLPGENVSTTITDTQKTFAARPDTIEKSKVQISEFEKEPPEKQAGIKGINLRVKQLPYKWVIIGIAIVFLTIIIIIIVRKQSKKEELGQEPEESGIEELELQFDNIKTHPLITATIKQGKEKNISRILIRKTHDESIGLDNLIIENIDGELYARAQEGTLKINGITISINKTREIKNDDIIQVGNQYFRTKLEPKNGKIKITFVGISKEHAKLMMKTKE